MFSAPEVGDNRLSVFDFFTFLHFCKRADIKVPLCLVPISELTHKHTHTHTHTRTPMLLSFEPTYSISIWWHTGTSRQIAAPGYIRYLSKSDIYGSCFSFPFCIESIQLSVSSRPPTHLSGEVGASDWAVARLKKKKRRDLSPFCGADHFRAPRGGTAGETFISHFYLTALCLRQPSTGCEPPLFSIVRPANCQITTKSLCTPFKCFCRNELSGLRLIHDPVRQQKWWKRRVNGVGSLALNMKSHHSGTERRVWVILCAK